MECDLAGSTFLCNNPLIPIIQIAARSFSFSAFCYVVQSSSILILPCALFSFNQLQNKGGFYAPGLGPNMALKWL